MDGQILLTIIEANGPTQVERLREILATEGVEATTAEITSALRQLENQKKLACTPRANWRLAGVAALQRSAEKRAAKVTASHGTRTRALIYSPEIIRDTPALRRNTFLHYVGDETGGFRLRDYADGDRVEVKHVGGIAKTAFLESAYQWITVDFDEEASATPLTDNAFWERRIAGVNAEYADRLARGADVIAEGASAHA